MAGPFHSHWRRLIGGSAALLAAAFVAPLFVPAPDLDENRLLAMRPEPPRDLASLVSFHTAVDAYVADHFPPRAHLIGALNFLRLQAGVSGSSRVIAGRDGWLFYDTGSHLGAARGEPRLTPAATADWLGRLAGRTEAAERKGAAYLVVVPPDKEAAYPAHAPSWFRLDPDRNAVRLPRLAARAHAGEVLYLGPAMAGVDQAYSPHDTHWTGTGAYAGYAALMRRLNQLGLTEGPRPRAAFAPVAEGAGQRPANLAQMLGVASLVKIDYPQLADPAGEAAARTTYLTDRVNWTEPRVIDTGQTDKPVLLLTMDSFSIALLPFLYGHFSRIVVTHLDDGPWREDLIDRFRPDIVILEVEESGLTPVMASAPPASPDVLGRIQAVIRDPQAVTAAPPAAPRPPVERGPLAPVAGRTVHDMPGSAGPDTMTGTPNADFMTGFGGRDRMSGLGGADILHGGRDGDVLDGGDGDDWLNGGRGADTLTGGRGADTFTIAAGGGADVVTDFNPAEGDRVVLDAGTAFRLLDAGDDTVVEVGGARLVLKGVRRASLPRGAVRAR